MFPQKPKQTNRSPLVASPFPMIQLTGSRWKPVTPQTLPTTIISDHRTCLSWAASCGCPDLVGWMDEAVFEVWALYLHHAKLLNKRLKVEHILKKEMLQSYMQIMQTPVALDIRVWVDWEKNFEIPLTVALIDVKWCFTLLDLYKSSVFVCAQNDKENTVVTFRSQQGSTSPKFHSTQKVADMVILRVIVCSLWAM